MIAFHALPHLGCLGPPWREIIPRVTCGVRGQTMYSIGPENRTRFPESTMRRFKRNVLCASNRTPGALASRAPASRLPADHHFAYRPPHDQQDFPLAQFPPPRRPCGLFPGISDTHGGASPNRELATLRTDQDLCHIRQFRHRALSIHRRTWATGRCPSRCPHDLQADVAARLPPAAGWRLHTGDRATQPDDHLHMAEGTSETASGCGGQLAALHCRR